ncbi:MAG: T9SS type B sorting domain-containing protein, partial [Cyclobacteriaceae bacterium]|nr:T9SS type B sorting domain-containing protein [Cyclobacteriaceae bacterium]
TGNTGGGTLSYWTDAAATVSLATPAAIATSGTYYIKSANGVCFDIEPVVVTVVATPALVITNPASVCFPTTVDITASAVTAGSTNLGALTYWTNSAATSSLATPTAIATSGTYYIKSTTGSCVDIKPVVVTINPNPVLLITNPSAVCFPGAVDLTATTITAGSDAGTLSYWTNSTATTSLNNPTSVAIGGTYYIKISSSNGCSTIKPVTVTINPLPVVSLPNDAHICIDINGNPTTTSSLSTGLSTALYNFVWYNDTTSTSVLLPETGNTLTVTALGTYRVEVENKSTGCKKEASATVVSSLPPSTMQFVTSSYFEDDAVITVNVTPPGVYEYQIDNGEFQESNQFIGLNSGDHTVYVRDKFGCDEIYATVKLLNFPHFFTPNGDDYNDRWNISDLEDQPNAKIYIFDRYGKLMKQITTAGEGWDGTFNKTPLPADDYWFTIEYQEQGVTKIFKSHFALKR